jgi:hypothetical protein
MPNWLVHDGLAGARKGSSRCQIIGVSWRAIDVPRSCRSETANGSGGSACSFEWARRRESCESRMGGTRRKAFDRALRDLAADCRVNFTKMPGIRPAFSTSML